MVKINCNRKYVIKAIQRLTFNSFTVVNRYCLQPISLGMWIDQDEKSVFVRVCPWLNQISNMNLDDLTYQIRGAIFEVNKVLGSGFLEKVYENSLMFEFLNRGLKAESQVPIKVKYKGEIVGEYFPDIVVENQIIIELKSIDALQKVHEAQLLNYLKATDYKLGLLVNFTHPKAEIKRFVL